MGLGRLGAIAGPLAIGLLVSQGWQIGDTFAALGIPALCAALFTSLISVNQPRRAAAGDEL
jgi:MFS family permease